MRQTDKCENLIKASFIDEYGEIHRYNNKCGDKLYFTGEVILCDKCKSHSHKPKISCVVDVRASEGYDKVNFNTSPSPSVPYTPLNKYVEIAGKWYPLTKDKRYRLSEIEIESEKIYGQTEYWNKEEQVLSALNGLKMDNCHNVIFRKYSKYCDVCEACKSINKWFPIFDEVKE